MRLLLPLLIAVGCAAAHEAPSLPASALPAGASETVLPTGAILHLRLAGLGQVLESIDRLVVPFVPPKAVPAELRDLLDQPRPLLAFLGAQSIGQPLTPEAITQVTGVAADRALTLTFYPASPEEGFVLALPIGNHDALLGLLLNLTGAVGTEPIDLGGRPGLDILVGNPALPGRMVAVTSPDTLFLCGSPELATRLTMAGRGPALAASPAVASTLAAHAAADLAVVLDAGMLKGLLPMVQRNFATIPPSLIAQARARLDELEPAARGQIDLRLRMELGISLAAFIDYTECLAVASYETLVATMVRELAGLDGLALTLDLGERDQRAGLSLFAAGVEPAGWTKPIPRAEAAAALALLPGGRDLVAIVGQDPAPAPSAFAAAWATNVEARLAAKRLPPAFGQQLSRFAAAQVAAPTLAARLPWSMETLAVTVPVPRPDAATSLGAWLAALGTWFGTVGNDRIMLLPTGDGTLLEQHLRETAAAADANAAAWRALSEPMLGEPFADSEHRVRSEPMADGIGTIVSEDAWITRRGILGYTQHELINRSLTRWRAHAGHLLVQHSAHDTRWIAGVSAEPRPVPPALAELLAVPPADASAIAVGRQLHRVIDLVDLLVEVEALARRELDAYLAAARAIDQRHAGDPDALAEALAGLDMPLLVAALERGGDGKLGCRLLGDLHYPRPAMLPLVRSLFADYAAKADRVGGGVAWQRIAAGHAEWALVQRTDGLATLVRTVGDTLWGTYLSSPKGQRMLGRTLRVRGDWDPGRKPVAINPLWAAFTAEP